PFVCVRGRIGVYVLQKSRQERVTCFEVSKKAFVLPEASWPPNGLSQHQLSNPPTSEATVLPQLDGSAADPGRKGSDSGPGRSTGRQSHAVRNLLEARGAAALRRLFPPEHGLRRRCERRNDRLRSQEGGTGQPRRLCLRAQSDMRLLPAAT